MENLVKMNQGKLFEGSNQQTTPTFSKPAVILGTVGATIVGLALLKRPRLLMKLAKWASPFLISKMANKFNTNSNNI